MAIKNQNKIFVAGSGGMVGSSLIRGLEKLDSNKAISNIHMATQISNNTHTYSYKIKNGISNIKGGVKVLKDLNFPDTIITNTINYLKK